MVYNSSIIKAISSKLKFVKIPIILDPVLKSTTGGVLMAKNSISDYKKFLVPLGLVITPNKNEAEMLSGIKIRTKKDLLKCAKKICKIGTKNVIITGVGLGKNRISDLVLQDGQHHFNITKKLSQVNHGSGCTYSSTLAVCIANGKNIRDSSIFSQKYTVKSIKNAEKLGKGFAIIKTPKIDPIKKNLKNAAARFVKIKNIYSLVPEVQTNFVYSKLNPKSTKDVVGITGRIIKLGKTVRLVGDFEYGGSQHVASAIIAINKKFPTIRSAINIKFNSKILKKFHSKRFRISDYDRTKEPTSIKNKENFSILWGVNKAIQKFSTAPDVIFHRGSFGKEPMIIVFGEEPDKVVDKISKLF
jgi:hydroxymethylpyrimidine/phosphomethylpyrimidine kinase